MQEDYETYLEMLKLVVLDGGQESIKQANYVVALAQELEALVCRSKDIWVAKGILRRMVNDAYGIPHIPYVLQLANRLRNSCHTLIAQLDYWDREFLDEMAEQAVSQPAASP